MAILLPKEDQQLELLLEELPFREDADMLSKILSAKNGDQVSYEEVYARYKPILTSKYIGKMINFTHTRDTVDDYMGILNLLFVEAINSYNPTKSKFITHLINRIRFKFYINYIKERLINVPSGTKSVIVKELIKQTVCAPIGGSTSFDIIMKPVVNQNTVGVKIGDDTIELDRKLFVESVLLANIKTLLPREFRAIYKTYIKNFLKNERTAVAKTAKRHSLTVQYIYIVLKKCNKIIQDKIQIV